MSEIAPLTPTEIVQLRIDPAAEILRTKASLGRSNGLVLYRTRANGAFEYVVHRWGVRYTPSGALIPGGMLYSGGYHRTLAEALEDYRVREPEND